MCLAVDGSLGVVCALGLQLHSRHRNRSYFRGSTREKLFCLWTFFPKNWYLCVKLEGETILFVWFFSIYGLVFEKISNYQVLLVILYWFRNNRSHQPYVLEQNHIQFKSPCSNPNKTIKPDISILLSFSFVSQVLIFNSYIQKSPLLHV